VCLFPISASLSPEGGRPTLDKEGSLKLPCGKCHECISKRAVEWATRARHEMSLHDENSFITLTYAPENLNSNFIIKTDFQNFMKKLRKKLKKKISYMVSYEYGSQFYRPHMHAIIFGYNPNKQMFLKNTNSGYPLFTSPELEELWDKGFHSIAEANEKTAYYIASYALSGKAKTIFHPDTGEEVEISDTMDVSKRPAIGLNYIKDNYKQIIDSKEFMPRYYVKKLEQYYEAKKSDNPTKSQIKLMELFKNVDEHLLFQYEEYLQNIKNNSSSGEMYARHVIKSQKIDLQDFTYREDTKERRRRDFEKRQLKDNAHTYVRYTQEKKYV
jgi:hypothetical protein